MRAAPLALLVVIAAACARPESEPARGGPEDKASAAWSRASARPLGERSRLGGAPTIASADPAALDELLAAAPASSASPTAPEGGTLVGTETGAPEPEAPAATDEAPAAAAKPRVTVGAVEVQAEMSTPAVEKAARAQLYWDLVQRCRDPEGKLLPPDAITLSFNIDADGTIVVPTILASAADPRFDEAAACMRRELSGAAFRGPAGARGLPTHVTATVPSVD